MPVSVLPPLVCVHWRWGRWWRGGKGGTAGSLHHLEDDRRGRVLLLGEGVEQREERHVCRELQLEVGVAARALELGEHRRRRVARARHLLGGDEVGEHL